MKRFIASLSVLLLVGLGGCGTTYSPDYSVKVVPSADGKSYTAVPPECARWADNDPDPLDNKPLPQFGCANARNLAQMVDRPEDLLQGRPSGPASGVLAAGSILRYNNNQTRGLIYVAPQSDNGVDATSATTATSAMTGETPPASPAAAGK